MAAGAGPGLRICLLSYRSNPHSGGQGVYLDNLSRALQALGHRVEVVSGPPDPQLSEGITVHRLKTLDLYDPADPFRMPTLGELSRPINLIEWLGVSTAGFPEPFTFGLHAYRFLRSRLNRYDIVHDNQSLSYGLWAVARRVPTVATIHHPISVDRKLAIRAVRTPWKKFKQLRWHSFIGMQKRVAACLPRIITVSERAAADISQNFGIGRERFAVVPNGIRTDLFHPMPGVPRERGRIIVTNSSDTPLKGLYHLLKAMAAVNGARRLHLVVIGRPKKGGGIEKLIARLGIGERVTFTGRIDHKEYVRQYARAEMAVVPSVYEGFGLPAGEAMACAVPVISTTGGALPEVVGDAGLLVPPADPPALARAIETLYDHPQLAAELGAAGRRRVLTQFTWERAAQGTEAVYREVVDDHRRF
ncbi:MAG: glycosyltransferase family 4 protein [Desulfobacterales bacterium]|nr:glycosyltransferase family 4 protein [Desulfobacterales bacterium]